MKVRNIFEQVAAWADLNKPQILGAVSKTATVAGAVASAVGTVKAVKSVSEAKNYVTNCRECTENGIMTTEEAKKAVKKSIAKTAFSVAKAYIPAIGFVTLSLVSATAEEKVLNERNAAIMAAYMTLSSSYNAYRDRVQAAFGQEAEQDILLKKEEYINKKTGEVVKVATEEDNNMIVWYEPRYGDGRGTEFWDEIIGTNEVMIRQSINWAYNQAEEKGYVTENEFLKHLGFVPSVSAARNVLGWMDGDSIDIQILYAKRQMEPGWDYGEAGDPEEGYYNCIAMVFRNARPIGSELKKKGLMQ